MYGEEVAAVEEDPCKSEVGERPQDIDDGRGQSFARRFRKGSGERFSADAFDEVGQGVHEETSGEEAGDVGIPAHGGDFSKGWWRRACVELFATAVRNLVSNTGMPPSNCINQLHFFSCILGAKLKRKP